MTFEFRFSSDAEKQLQALDEMHAKRILKKLVWIRKQKNPLRHAKPLHHAKIGDIRFRIGEYRVVAVLNEKRTVAMIVAVGHRSEMYR
ncbi:MAG: type II toxin-antitoxin system RelE/ParE family toxin [bacterium]|nr:type II toxin-antitoxin system RelE/ParE family toxin [bacterium]